jgi:hypothetical protein
MRIRCENFQLLDKIHQVPTYSREIEDALKDENSSVCSSNTNEIINLLKDENNAVKILNHTGGKKNVDGNLEAQKQLNYLHVTRTRKISIHRKLVKGRGKVEKKLTK